MKTAVIMAAGLGTRFGRYTESIPKSFVEVGGRSMIVRSVEHLLACGISRIVIGTGFGRESFEALKRGYPQVETCFSPRYAETNSMYTLYNMRETVGSDDFILLESDLIYEPRAIAELIGCPLPDVMLVSPVIKFQDQYFVESDAEGVLTNCSTDRSELGSVSGELVGIHKLSNAFFRKMCDDYGCIADEQPRLGYEYELLRMSRSVSPVHVLCADGLKWYEIDDEADLAYAEEHVAGFC